MRRNDLPRLVKASRDDALRALTVGIPTLSVAVENRRQIFVESEDDQACYQAAFRIIAPEKESPFSLEFIASGLGGGGSNEAVKHLVGSLRNAGNTNVWGLIDRDERRAAPDWIVFNPSRYAIENLLLDPLLLCAYLVREKMIPQTEVGLDGRLKYFELQTVDHAVSMVRYVESRVLGSVTQRRTIAYVGGFEVDVASEWLDMNGHELEELIVGRFSELKRKGKALKLEIVNKALFDLPAFAPLELHRLFDLLLRP